jgi:hypothetical protein
MFLQAARDYSGDGQVVYTTVRDCYLELPHDDECEEVLRTQGVHYIRDGSKIYVLGEDAYTQAGMAEFATKPGDEILKRPMRDGILNPSSPKMALSILRALMKACLEKGIGPARKGEILYFSVPATPLDSSIDAGFHAAMAQAYLRDELSYDAHPMVEGLAVVYAENPKMHAKDGLVPYTGIGISFGAGQANFCLAEKGRSIQDFSVCRSGDWIDERVATMTGESRTKVLRVKEKYLDFDELDVSSPLILALNVYYEALIKYVFGKFAERFSNNRGTIEDPIDVVLSGGTACPKGFDTKVKKVLAGMNLPFKINEVRLAGGGDKDEMLKAVAKGCYIRARQAAKKLAKEK